MPRVRNLNNGTFKRFKKKQATLASQTPLSSTAVERGSTRWLDGSTVVIEGLFDLTGTGNVSGSLNVSGTFTGSGTNNLSGVNNLSGENHLTGPTDVAGNFDIIAGGEFHAGTVTIRPDGSADFGNLLIDPTGKLTSGLFELNPDGSGKIGSTEFTADGDLKVGTNMTLSPSVDGGSITFQDGSRVRSVGGTVQVGAAGGSGGQFTAGLNTAGLSAGPNGALMGVDDAGEWWMQGAGSSIQSIGNRISASGDLDVTGALNVDDVQLAPSGSPANIHWDSATKRFYLANP